MKWNREDLGYLKKQLIRDIIGLIGMIIMFIIGLVKNIRLLSIVGFFVVFFYCFSINKNNNNDK